MVLHPCGECSMRQWVMRPAIIAFNCQCTERLSKVLSGQPSQTCFGGPRFMHSVFLLASRLPQRTPRSIERHSPKHQATHLVKPVILSASLKASNRKTPWKVLSVSPTYLFPHQSTSIFVLLRVMFGLQFYRDRSQAFVTVSWVEHTIQGGHPRQFDFSNYPEPYTPVKSKNGSRTASRNDGNGVWE